MSGTEITRDALLDMLRAHILHAQKYELPVIGQAQTRIKMGVSSVEVEALFHRELALARTKVHRGSNVINGPWGTAA